MRETTDVQKLIKDAKAALVAKYPASVQRDAVLSMFDQAAQWEAALAEIEANAKEAAA